MWIVVATIENNERCCTAVPVKWVVNDQLLYPFSINELRSGRKKQIDPKANWKTLVCKTISEPFGCFKDALAAEKRLTKHLTVEPANESNNEKLNRRKHPVLHAGFTSDAEVNRNDLFDLITADIYETPRDKDDYSDDINDTFPAHETEFPIEIYQNGAVASEAPFGGISTSSIIVCDNQSVPSVCAAQAPIVITVPKGDECKFESMTSTMPSSTVYSTLQSHDTNMYTFGSQMTSIDKRLADLQLQLNGLVLCQKALLKQIELISKAETDQTEKFTILQAQTKVKLDSILNYLQSSSEKPTEDFTVQFQTITSIEGVMKMEADLKKPAFKNKMIQILSRLGGSSEKTAARNILRYIVKDEVLQLFTWKSSTAHKGIFHNFNEINNTITSAVRNNFPTYTEQAHNQFMQGDLKHSKFRVISKGKSKSKNDPDSENETLDL